jgi:Mn2+/Fe2+ NRAMP family transporter
VSTAVAGNQRGIAIVLRALTRILIYTIPIIVALGSVYLVTRAYQTCKGSDALPTATRFEHVAALFVLPALMYVVLVVVVVTTDNASLRNRLLQTAAVSLVVAAVFVWFRVRYYEFDGATCASGLPLWWPNWLPAR